MGTPDDGDTTVIRRTYLPVEERTEAQALTRERAIGRSQEVSPYLLQPSPGLPCDLCPVLDERPVIILFKRDPQFLLGIHHNGAVPGHRLTDGPSGNEQKPDRFVLC